MQRVTNVGPDMASRWGVAPGAPFPSMPGGVFYHNEADLHADMMLRSPAYAAAVRRGAFPVPTRGEDSDWIRQFQ